MQFSGYHHHHTVLAQRHYIPDTLFSLHSVFVDGKALYIHGGLDTEFSDPSPQTFLLNLSVPWNVSNPVFQQLPDRYTGGWGTASTLLNDRRTWLLIDNETTISQFDIGPTARDWIHPESEFILAEEFRISAVAALTDPETNQVYVVDGWNNTGMLMYKPVDETSEQDGPLAPVDDGYAAIWSTVRKSMLVHGGTVNTTTGRFYRRSLFEYAPVQPPDTNPNQSQLSGRFTALTDVGDIPPPRTGHCMVPTNDGNQVVVFGGFDENGTELGDIYVLDVATLQWTAGGNGGTTVARGYAACGMSDSLFVAWGGARRQSNNSMQQQVRAPLVPIAENITVVYNLTSHMWQTTYAAKPGDMEKNPPLTTTSSRSPKGTATNTASPSPSPGSEPPVAAIVGGSVVGGLAVFAAGAGLFLYRLRSQNRVQPMVAKMSDVSGHSLWWNRRQGGGSGGDGGLDEPPGHTFLRLESANGSNAGSVYILREVPDSLVQGYQQQQQSTEESIERPGEVVARARRDPQLVTIGRAFTYRDTPLDP
ncbi:hypothetical protein BGX33_003106 [Mortierella sp. NVP41]|nr:hypothetical protein BGX33_003106 [Mortierella sp. NVP41]